VKTRGGSIEQNLFNLPRNALYYGRTSETWNAYESFVDDIVSIEHDAASHSFP
jgi:hypothetical protein